MANRTIMTPTINAAINKQHIMYKLSFGASEINRNFQLMHCLIKLLNIFRVIEVFLFNNEFQNGYFHFHISFYKLADTVEFKNFATHCNLKN